MTTMTDTDIVEALGKRVSCGPRYELLFSKDALQPILDGLTEEEKLRLSLEIVGLKIDLDNRDELDYFAFTLKPKELAHLLVKALKLGKETAHE